MNKIIDFVAGLFKLAVAVLTAFFAVCGAGEMIPLYMPWFNEIGDASIALAIVYFLFVMLMVKIGMDYYKAFTDKAGKKR